MSWIERLEQKISEKRSGAAVAKGAKASEVPAEGPLATLATAESMRFQKKHSRKTEPRLRVYHYRLTDNPDSRLVLIAPGTSLEQATENLRARFGPRLLGVEEYGRKS